MMYAKIFAQMFTGSMYGAGPQRFVVWVYAVVKMSHNYTVELNPAILAHTIGMTFEEAEVAIEWLCSPDPKSRTPDYEGRRLIHDGGFMYSVVNGPKYKAIRSEDDRREYFRMKKREERERKRKLSQAPPEPGEDRDDPEWLADENRRRRTGYELGGDHESE